MNNKKLLAAIATSFVVVPAVNLSIAANEETAIDSIETFPTLNDESTIIDEVFNDDISLEQTTIVQDDNEITASTGDSLSNESSTTISVLNVDMDVQDNENTSDAKTSLETMKDLYANTPVLPSEEIIVPDPLDLETQLIVFNERTETETEMTLKELFNQFKTVKQNFSADGSYQNSKTYEADFNINNIDFKASKDIYYNEFFTSYLFYNNSELVAKYNADNNTNLESGLSNIGEFVFNGLLKKWTVSKLDLIDYSDPEVTDSDSLYLWSVSTENPYYGAKKTNDAITFEELDQIKKDFIDHYKVCELILNGDSYGQFDLKPEMLNIFTFSNTDEKVQIAINKDKVLEIVKPEIWNEVYLVVENTNSDFSQYELSNNLALRFDYINGKLDFSSVPIKDLTLTLNGTFSNRPQRMIVQSLEKMKVNIKNVETNEIDSFDIELGTYTYNLFYFYSEYPDGVQDENGLTGSTYISYHLSIYAPHYLDSYNQLKGESYQLIPGSTPSLGSYTEDIYKVPNSVDEYYIHPMLLMMGGQEYKSEYTFLVQKINEQDELKTFILDKENVNVNLSTYVNAEDLKLDVIPEVSLNNFGLDDNYKTYGYNLCLVDQIGQTIEVDGDYTITIAVPDDIKDKEIVVFRAASGFSRSSDLIEILNGNAVIKTNSLGTFVLAAKLDIDQPENPENPDNPSNPNGPTTPDKPSIPDKPVQPGEDERPSGEGNKPIAPNTPDAEIPGDEVKPPVTIKPEVNTKPSNDSQNKPIQLGTVTNKPSKTKNIQLSKAESSNTEGTSVTTSTVLNTRLWSISGLFSVLGAALISFKRKD